jgi:hypothetical protein
MLKNNLSLKTFIFISVLLLVNCMNIRLKTFQNRIRDTNLFENDELAGSLLDIISPQSDLSNMFNIDEQKFLLQLSQVSNNTTQTNNDNTQTNVSNKSTKNTTDLETSDNNTQTQPTKTATTNTNKTVTDTQSTNDNNTINNTNNVTKDQTTTPTNSEIQNKTEIVKQEEKLLNSTKSKEIETLVKAINNSKLHFNIATIPNDLKLFNKHAPFPIPETNVMRYISILSILIFGIVYMGVRCLLSGLKPRDKFVSKSLKKLGSQSLLYFIGISLLLYLHTFGIFDTIKINWDYLICAIGIFGVIWILFSISIIFFCKFIVDKWTQLESSCKSFGKI